MAAALAQETGAFERIGSSPTRGSNCFCVHR
jgi:hypothetical protein